ncbi:CG33644, partial [Drosophila busckii]
VKVQLEKFECRNHWSKLLNINCYLNTTAESEDGISVEFNTTEDLTTLHGMLYIDFFHNNHWVNYYKNDIDYCEILEMIQKDFVTRFLGEQLRRLGNLPFKCPFKKVSIGLASNFNTLVFITFQNRKYYVHDFAVAKKILPSYMPQLTFRSQSVYIFNQRKLSTFKLEGLIKRS